MKYVSVSVHGKKPLGVYATYHAANLAQARLAERFKYGLDRKGERQRQEKYERDYGIRWVMVERG